MLLFNVLVNMRQMFMILVLGYVKPVQILPSLVLCSANVLFQQSSQCAILFQDWVSCDHTA
jgi:hypothetical protein